MCILDPFNWNVGDHLSQFSKFVTVKSEMW